MPSLLEPGVKYRAISPTGEHLEARVRRNESMRRMEVDLYALGFRADPVRGVLKTMVQQGWVFLR